MPIEIERKFLLANEDWRAAVSRSTRLRDGILAFYDGRKIRIRFYDEKATLTVKGPRKGLARDEFEYEIRNRPIVTAATELDAGDEFRVIDKVVEERVPGFGGDARVPEHVFQFIDTVIGQGGDGVIRAGIDADDRAIGQVVVVVDDGFEKLGVFAQHLCDVVEGADVGDGCHQAASCRAEGSGDQFQGNRSSSRLIL